MVYTYGLASRKLANNTISNKYNTVQMSQNSFTRQLPKHRFIDYSKAQLNNNLMERKFADNYGKSMECKQMEAVIDHVGTF